MSRIGIEAAACECCGNRMAVINTTFAYVKSGTIIATVKYLEDDDSGELYAAVEAMLLTGIPLGLPMPEDDHLGEAIQDMRYRDELIEFGSWVKNVKHLWRIDYHRPDAVHTLTVWLPEVTPTGLGMAAGVVHSYHRSDRPEDVSDSEFPDLMTVADLHDLIQQPEVITIRRFQDIELVSSDGDEIDSVEHGSIIVWDVAAIWREWELAPSAPDAIIYRPHLDLSGLGDD